VSHCQGSARSFVANRHLSPWVEPRAVVAVEPTYCHQCGAELESVEIDGRERGRCPDCDQVWFRNAIPSACVIVRDGDRVLLIERAPSASETWAIPGGHPEWDEAPVVGAARELAEETGLRVDPADLTLSTVIQGIDERLDLPYYLISYTVDRSETTGTLDAATDADDARFWSIRELLDDDRVRDVGKEAVEVMLDR